MTFQSFFLWKVSVTAVYSLEQLFFDFNLLVVLSSLSPAGDFDLQRVKESTYFFSWEDRKDKLTEGDEWNRQSAAGEAAGPGVPTDFVSLRHQHIDPAMPCCPGLLELLGTFTPSECTWLTDWWVRKCVEKITHALGMSRLPILKPLFGYNGT